MGLLSRPGKPWRAVRGPRLKAGAGDWVAFFCILFLASKKSMARPARTKGGSDLRPKYQYPGIILKMAIDL